MTKIVSKDNPIRYKWSTRLNYPKDIYKGNTNHWAIQRSAAEEYVSRQRLKEQLRSGEVPEAELLPDGTSVPFMWSREKARLMASGGKPFNDFILEALGNELPGSLYREERPALWKKDLPMAHIMAMKGVRYWWHEDEGKQLSNKKRPISIDFSMATSRIHKPT